MADMLPVEMTVNGHRRAIVVPANVTLLDLLRDELGLTGTKECCDVGECGACTVLVNGRAVDSCLMLAVEADGAEITTVEGLAVTGELSPLQQAFLDKGASQCGFCTPGQLMAAHALLQENPDPSLPQIQEGLSGNLCRCGCYYQIADAVLAVAQSAHEGGRK